jgi:hypothetical protein
VTLPDPSAALAVRDKLLGWIRQTHAGLDSLDQYHRLELADDDHFSLIYRLSVLLWESDLGREIAGANLSLFRALLGPDLHYQRYPYLRAVRPNRISDAAPMHRDTYYGASAYELSCVIPFTDMPAGNAIRVISGSHLAPDEHYPYRQTISPDVVSGTPKHKLGYAYAPRLLDPKWMDLAEPIPVKLGQALIFPLSLVHGGGISTTDHTRFSMDIRVVASWAPVAFSRGVHKDYFLPLCSSAISECAKRYLDANQNAKPMENTEEPWASKW